MTENRTVKSGLFVVAVTVAFSRVYLSEHFFGDIYAGGLISLAIAMVVVVGVERWGKGTAWLDGFRIR